jgi:hypothetical protein
MMELIAAAVREREGAVSLPHARQLGGQIGELIGDQMEHFAFPLHPAPNRDHAGGQNIGLIAKHVYSQSVITPAMVAPCDGRRSFPERF